MSDTLYDRMKRMASEACYWKEDAQNKSDWSTAFKYELVEATWNQAAEMVQQFKKELEQEHGLD